MKQRKYWEEVLNSCVLDIPEGSSIAFEALGIDDNILYDFERMNELTSFITYDRDISTLRWSRVILDD